MNTLLFGAVLLGVAGLAVWLGFRYASKSGASEVRADVAKDAAEKKDAMLKAEVDGPRTRDDVVKRLRDSGF